jgi:hypothetical protein
MTKIWQWFKSVLTGALTGISDLASKVYQGVKAIIDRIESVFILIYDAWSHPVATAKALLNYLVNFARDTAYAFNRAWNKWVVPLIIKAEDLAHRIEDYFWKGVLKAEEIVSNASGLIWDYLKGFKTWILNTLWSPLENSFKQAWQWISTRGEVVWQLIEHPERLAKLLLEPLAEAAWWFIKESTDLIAQFLLVGWMKATLAVVDVVEDVFSKLV